MCGGSSRCPGGPKPSLETAASFHVALLCSCVRLESRPPEAGVRRSERTVLSIRFEFDLQASLPDVRTDVAALVLEREHHACPPGKWTVMTFRCTR